MSTFFEITLLVLLVIFSIASACSKNVLASLLIYMPYSIILACVLFTLRAPDLEITKAAVDVGISMILFFLTMNRIKAIPLHKTKNSHIEENTKNKLKAVALWFKGELSADTVKNYPVKKGEKEVIIGRSGKINVNMTLVNRLGRIAAALAFLGVVAVMLVMCSQLPAFGDPQNPANNEVSKMYIEKSVEQTGALNAVTGMILDYRSLDTFAETTMLFTATVAVVYLLKAETTEGDKKRYSREKFE